MIDRARAEEVMVYAIGLESEYFNGQRRCARKPDGGLRKIADETGGGYFELKKTADLAPTFTRVAQELHSQYVIGFTPTQLDSQRAQAGGEDEAAGHDGAGAHAATWPPPTRSRVRRKSAGCGPVVPDPLRRSSAATITTTSNAPRPTPPTPKSSIHACSVPPSFQSELDGWPPAKV